MKKLVLLLAVVVLVVGASRFVGATFKWSQLGRAPLMEGIDDRLSFQEKFSSHQEEIIGGLKFAEPSWGVNTVFSLLNEAIRSDRVMETSFAPGQKFLWMIFKPKGKIGVVKDVEWAGKEKLDGFLVSLVYRDNEIKFFIPKKCGNLALMEKRALPVPKVEVPPPPVEYPAAKMALPVPEIEAPPDPIVVYVLSAPSPPQERIVERVVEVPVYVPQEPQYDYQRPVYQDWSIYLRWLFSYKRERPFYDQRQRSVYYERERPVYRERPSPPSVRER